MPAPVALISLATATAPHSLPQTVALEAARGIFRDRGPWFERLAPVFTNSGVAQRQIAMPLAWYAETHGWPDRAEVYTAVGDALFEAAARGALTDAGLDAGQVDAVVAVSSTGIATPGFEARAMTRLGFRPDLSRTPVFGLGCAGGVTGLSLAARLAAASPGSRVLLVVVELCSLAFRMDDADSADIVAAALFGDGAAACVVQAGGEGFAHVSGFGEHTWPDTLDIMGWRVDPQGLGVIFARAIPPFARERLRPALGAILEAQGLAFGDVDRFLCHPGGAKVIEALEDALRLDPGALDHERAVLSEHGNMSAPTALFVLDRARRAGLPARTVLTALGPGFTASAVTLVRPA
jgi:alkylresorcinol/alkylpyrone synthase